MIKKFKAKWNIQSDWQLLIILVVFSITGSAAMIVRKLVFSLIGITPDTTIWIKVPLYILILFPAYQVLLIIIGSLLGQFQFFYAFQKKSLRFLNHKRA
ncbi:MAG: hypothetical protein PF541_11560 [Prolixibacteraceae bacterium]|jgi:ferrochelatase|nr:hypothetical protein [Prolixibacteraceae bacterium]